MGTGPALGGWVRLSQLARLPLGLLGIPPPGFRPEVGECRGPRQARVAPPGQADGQGLSHCARVPQRVATSPTPTASAPLLGAARASVTPMPTPRVSTPTTARGSSSRRLTPTPRSTPALGSHSWHGTREDSVMKVRAGRVEEWQGAARAVPGLPPQHGPGSEPHLAAAGGDPGACSPAPSPAARRAGQ